MTQEVTSWTSTPRLEFGSVSVYVDFVAKKSESGMGFTASTLVLFYPYKINNVPYSFIHVSLTQYTHQFKATLNNARNTQVN